MDNDVVNDIKIRCELLDVNISH